MDLDTKRIATIMETNLFEPRAIVLDPRDGERRMYFTDWGFKHGIFRAGMDGAGRETLVETNLLWPNGLTIGRFKCSFTPKRKLPSMFIIFTTRNEVGAL